MDNELLRIMIVDDHRAVHQSLSELINFVDDFELVAQCSNGKEAVQLAQEHQPDVILMDVVMPIMDGIEATRQIIAKNPAIKIVALSSFQDNDSVRAMLQAGAMGYLLKNASADDIERIIRTVQLNKSVIDTQLMHQLLNSSDTETNNDYGLSDRELQILKLIGGGMSYAEIANQLTISMSTVKFHVGNILTKLDVDTRSEAIMMAAKRGII